LIAPYAPRRARCQDPRLPFNEAPSGLVRGDPYGTCRRTSSSSRSRFPPDQKPWVLGLVPHPRPSRRLIATKTDRQRKILYFSGGGSSASVAEGLVLILVPTLHAFAPSSVLSCPENSGGAWKYFLPSFLTRCRLTATSLQVFVAPTAGPGRALEEMPTPLLGGHLCGFLRWL